MLHKYAIQKLLILLFITAAIGFLAGSVKAATIEVNPGDSIQAAIDASAPGDTILVNSGLYKENVNVTKKLVLRGVDTGTGMPVVDAERNGSAITLSADEITLEGFAAINASWYPNAGIKVLSTNNVLIGNNASSNENGIEISRSTNNTLTGNRACNNWYGLYLYHSGNNTLACNNVSNNRMGIYLYRSNNNTFTDNSASSNDNIGSYLYLSENNIMKNNLMHDNRYNFYANGPNDIDTSNLVDGKPIYYLVDESSKVIDSSSNAGIVFCINCENITAKDLILTNNLYGIYLHSTDDSKVENNQLSSNSAGIYLYNSSRIEIFGNIASDNSEGIYISRSNNNTISFNNANSNEWSGIYLYRSDNNNISSNSFDNNEWVGLEMDYCSNNILRNNMMSFNLYNFYADGPNDIDTSNLVDGKSIYYLLNDSSTTIDAYSNAGCVFCINCENVTVKDQTISNSSYGIYFDNTRNSRMENNYLVNNFDGIALDDSGNNSILGNTAINCEDGIYLWNSSSNIISNNNATNNWDGICIWDSSSNTISGNSANNNWGGIRLWYSSSSTLTGNIAANSDYGGITLYDSNDNTLANNNAINSDGRGIILSDSSNNILYLNNFINNAFIAQSDSTNLWNSPNPLIYIYNGQPFESYMGNYWSDYNGTDTNDDGIGDDPYIFTSEEDRYPLMMEFENYIVSPNLNIDEIEMGSQAATSYGLSSSRPFSPFDETLIATNNIDIQKFQATKSASDRFGPAKFNIELIELEDQVATTSGSGRSANSIAIRTTQE